MLQISEKNAEKYSQNLTVRSLRKLNDEEVATVMIVG